MQETVKFSRAKLIQVYYFRRSFFEKRWNRTFLFSKYYGVHRNFLHQKYKNIFLNCNSFEFYFLSLTSLFPLTLPVSIAYIDLYGKLLFI